uniref:sulfotransferase family 2 domain-containing protein n=1 Tax=uncultured Rhizobium sp. TaxID=155567 RepID=UPI00261DD0E4|nr:sulfotransferase family 2 domain-containing protein [uncultured Rhizobium sp.]
MANLKKHFSFVHIPKAGGTSITEMLFELVEPEEIFPREELFNYPLFSDISAPLNPSLFISHFGYNFYRGAGGSCMTVMRDPVERILSLFSYWKNPGGKMAPGDPLPKDMRLTDFLWSEREDIRLNVDDAQTWQLAFSHDMATRRRLDGVSDEELVDVAKANLSRMEVVGVLEAQPHFIKQIERMFPRSRHLELSRYNATVERTARQAVGHADLAKIVELTSLDAKVYNFAAELAASRYYRALYEENMR